MRELVVKLIEMLQAFLVQLDKPATGAKPDYMIVAERELGVKEVRGGENPRILEYHSATALKASEDEVAWCSSFVNWVMKQCGYEQSHSAAARSWLSVGTKLTKFEPNCIVVFKRGNSTWQGHVAFGVADLGTLIKCLGGNQSDSVSYANYHKADVLGYFRPVKLKE